MYLYGGNLENVPPIRAGVIPFTIKNGHIYFLMGVDYTTWELTDFGGGVKATETLVDGAYRELMEESREIFRGTITVDLLRSSIVLTNCSQNVAIFFVYVDPVWLDCAEFEFHRNKRNFLRLRKYNELFSVRWVIDQEFCDIAFNRKRPEMWRRIQNIFRKNTSWRELCYSLVLGLDTPNVFCDSGDNAIACQA